jgi:hypothetical protein
MFIRSSQNMVGSNFQADTQFLPLNGRHPRRLEAAPLLAYQSECPVDHGQNSDKMDDWATPKLWDPYEDPITQVFVGQYSGDVISSSFFQDAERNLSFRFIW